MKYLLLTVFVLIVLALAVSCHHNADLSIAPPKPTPAGADFKCSHDTIYFQNFVLPVVLNGCAKSGCHDEASHRSGHVLDSYSNIISLVTPFNPTASKLYTVLFSNSQGRMPPDAPLSDDAKAIIYWWIAQGAYNNKCDSTGCDSASVTYTATISPIIQTWCLGCHSGSSPAHGLDLSTYANVVACANSNRLMGAIRRQTGYSAMPPVGALSTCDIALFQKWINLGKPQ